MTIGYPEIEGFTYLWDDGITESEREVKEPGLYKITVTTPGGNTNSGSIEVKEISDINLQALSQYYNYFYGDTISL